MEQLSLNISYESEVKIIASSAFNFRIELVKKIGVDDYDKIFEISHDMANVFGNKFLLTENNILKYFNENTLPFYKAGGVVDENNLLGFSPFNIVTYSIGNMGTEIPEEERGLNDIRPLTNVYSSQEMDLFDALKVLA